MRGGEVVLEAIEIDFEKIFDNGMFEFRTQAEDPKYGGNQDEESMIHGNFGSYDFLQGYYMLFDPSEFDRTEFLQHTIESVGVFMTDIRLRALLWTFTVWDPSTDVYINMNFLAERSSANILVPSRVDIIPFKKPLANITATISTVLGLKLFFTLFYTTHTLKRMCSTSSLTEFLSLNNLGILIQQGTLIYFEFYIIYTVVNQKTNFSFSSQDFENKEVKETFYAMRGHALRFRKILFYESVIILMCVANLVAMITHIYPVQQMIRSLKSQAATIGSFLVFLLNILAMYAMITLLIYGS